MEFHVESIPDSKTILIPVASQKMKTHFATDIKFITHKGVKYKVFDFFLVEKHEFYQRSLMKLAIGEDMDPEELWSYYPQSKSILLFVCDKIDQENQQENEQDTNNKLPRLDD